MQLFANISRGAYVLVGLIVGLRLLWLYRSSRQLPELLIGIGLISGGVLYNGYAWAATTMTSFPPLEYAILFSNLIRPFLALSAITVAVFAWKTSRRDSAWAPFLVLFIAAGMLVWLASGWFRDPSSPVAPVNPRGFTWQSRGFALLIAYVWATVESFLYYRNARRRQRIGLSTDPLVVNQSLFLGLSFATFAVFWGLEISVVAIGRPPPLTILGVTGLLRILMIWLAFLPPAFFTRWLVRRSNAPQEESA